MFLNSENSQTSFLVFTIHGKILESLIRIRNVKSLIRIINAKYRLQLGIKNQNYLIDHILYQVFEIILNIYQESKTKKQLILQ